MRSCCVAVLALLLLALVGCRGAKPSGRGAEAEGPKSPKVLMVVAPKDFRDEEYRVPRRLLEANDVEVEVASAEAGTAVGVKGTEAKVDITASAANVEDYDAVVFVGGPGMVPYLGNADFVRLAQQSVEGKKITAAICVAPAILANAGVLRNVNATAWPEQKAILKQKGAVLSTEDVVRSGKIITANGPMVAEQFGKEILQALKER